LNIPGPQDGIAWVTGASSGIGRAVAIALVKAGWTVAISARGAEALEALAALYPGKMIAAPLDITDPDAAKACVKTIEAAGRPVVRAILNAGIYIRDTAASFDAANFKAQTDVNLLGTANCLAAVMPGMIAAGRGQIGVVSSLTGLIGFPAAISYCTTKAGQIAMCQSLKFDLDKAGVAISVILPGFVKTPATDKNEFEMPYIMAAEDAAEEILRGLAADRFIIAFPGQLAWPLRIMRMLPAKAYFAIMSRITKW
jgi:NADP-dependent 3-hydroxy acid dehydrogenase YdfG